MNEPFGDSEQLAPDAGSGGDARAMLKSFGADDLREGSRSVGHSGVDSDEWEDYIEVPVRILHEIAAALAARQPVGVEPFELRICEVRHTLLKPNKPYIFTIDPNCKACRAQAAYAIGETSAAPPAPAAVPVGLQDIIGSMLNYAGVADTCEVTQGHAPVAIRNWAEMLQQLAWPSAVPVDVLWRLSDEWLEMAGEQQETARQRAFWGCAKELRDLIATHPQPAAACVNINAMRYLYLRAQPVEGGPWGTPRIAIPSSERAGEFANGDDADAAIDAAIAAQQAKPAAVKDGDV